MDIGILSMQRVSNFGSLLQSYALKRMLEDFGCRVFFIDIEPDERDNALLKGHCGNTFQEGERSGTVLSKLKKVDRYTLNRIKMKMLSNRQNGKFEAFRCDYLGIHGIAEDALDLCVIGSDEVFNCLSGAAWGFTGQLFGMVPQAKRVITYAASCGSTRLEQVPDSVSDRISEAFQNVSAFSVRDNNTEQFVARIAGMQPEVHLDPAAVFDFSEEVAAAQLPEECTGRYCVVYSYYNRISDREEIRQIQTFCRNHNLRIVAVGAPQKWIGDYLVLDPFEMLNVFANASFIITDTFHGTVFSAKYAGRFAVLVRESNANKLEDLIDRLSLQTHKITSFACLEAAYGVQTQRQHLDGLLMHEREKTLGYLEKNLHGDHYDKNSRF